MSKKGLLLLNIGSPQSYEVTDVKKYLRTFLMDEDIINIPFFVRWPLVNGIIVPRRSPYSAANYKKIWMEGEGSPLTVYTKRFTTKLQENLGSQYVVKIGMRYSEPSIQKALREFSKESVDSLVLVPLYPQYAEATTGSSLKEVRRQMGKEGLDIPTKILPPFFTEPFFINSTVEIAQRHLQGRNADHILFSFHGLPESQIRKIEGCLTTKDCCSNLNSCAKNCYSAQCYATAKAIAQQMNLKKDQWSVAFQSRLGRGEWLKPSTDQTIQALAEAGKKNIAVLCPSFVSDCIETLEEIGIGGKELFLEKGGEEYHLIPCLNDEDAWTTRFAEHLKANF